MADADDALREATRARLSEIVRAAAIEMAGPGASEEAVERALLTLSPVLAEVLREDPRTSAWLLGATRTAAPTRRR